jgi:hypothetical protein
MRGDFRGLPRQSLGALPRNPVNNDPDAVGQGEEDARR